MHPEMIAGLRQSVRSNTRGAFARSYVGEVDYFAVYCPANNGVYFIPIDEVPGAAGSLRISPTENNQAVRVRWAHDYELPTPPIDLDFG